jgi:hypothetical protein
MKGSILRNLTWFRPIRKDGRDEKKGYSKNKFSKPNDRFAILTRERRSRVMREEPQLANLKRTTRRMTIDHSEGNVYHCHLLKVLQRSRSDVGHTVSTARNDYTS